MNRLLACRVCLAYDTRLCSIVHGQLREIYEKFVEASLNTEDMLLTSVCYICYSLMKKMLQFRDRSRKANQILQQMISSGLEPSVSSLDMLVKNQSGISWNLGNSDVVKTTTASAEDKVKVKTEFVESEMDIDGMSDRDEVITKPDAREIVVSKEDQLQGVCERAKSLDYQNCPFKCDLCSEAFVDARAYENHKEKHDEPSVSSLDMLVKNQSGISWTLGKSDVVETTTTSAEDKVKVKTESVESEMDIDGMSDRDEVITKPDAREIVVSKEDQLQGVCERAKSLDYQNCPFKCDLCSEAFVDARAYENHKEKHDEPSVSSLDILDWHNRQTSISYPLGISDIDRSTTTTTTGEVEVKVKIESEESEIDIDEMSDGNEGAAPLENRKLDNNEAENESVNIRATLRNTEKDEEPKEKKDVSKKIPAFIKGSRKKLSHLKTILKETKTTTSNIISDEQKDTEFNKNDTVTPPKDIFTCDLCKCEYQCKILLESHIKKSHVIKFNPKDSINSDSNVTKQCKRTNSLTITILKAQEIQNNDNPIENDRCENKFRDNTSQYVCQYCMKRFNSNSHLSRHLRVHNKPFKCDLCEKGFTQKSDLSRHLRVHTKEKPFKCDICEKGFTQKNHLSRHLRFHTKEKPFKCDICEKGFSDRSSLTTHLRVHTKEKPFKCDLCEKSFSDRSTLTRHLRIHTKEKPFKCEICEKSFTQSSNLSRHLRAHTNEKPLKCDLCEKGFLQNGSLIAHLRIHTKEKPFTCDICEKGFSKTGSLIAHLRVHTKEKPFKCYLCEKGFSQNGSLIAHLRIHTKEKPFKCDICKKGFNQSSHLSRHLRVHNKEKPFKCDLCEKGFSDKSNFIKHLKVHTKAILM